jgi:PEP-CTERM/exosortase A-associated glycosyltransferase
MRILHVLDHSLPLHSGYSFRTAAILREQRALGWDTEQMTTPRQNSGSAPTEQAAGWVFHRTPYAPGALARLPAVGRYLDEMRATAERIDALVKVRRPDLIHAHSPVLNVLPALRVGRRHGIPVAYEMRASWEDAAVDHGSTRQGSLRYHLSRALETYALRRVGAITTICEGLQADIVSRGIAAQRVTVIPNAVDVHAFAFDAAPDEALRAQLGLERSSVIGFAGSFYAYEGLDLLLQAASRLLAKQRDLRVLLVGGGPQETALRQQAQQLGMGDRVVFTGRVPHDQVQRYYDLIDVLAYPRHSMRLTELVTPLKPLEAMAQGRMFVASDVGGHRELIRDGDTGHLFRAGDVNALAQVIERVLDGRAEWDAMRRRARRHVENERTWARSVARYRDVYQRLLSASGAAGIDAAAQRG